MWPPPAKEITEEHVRELAAYIARAKADTTERRIRLRRAHWERAVADTAALFDRADGAILRFVERNVLPFVAGMAFAAFLMWLVS